MKNRIMKAAIRSTARSARSKAATAQTKFETETVTLKVKKKGKAKAKPEKLTEKILEQVRDLADRRHGRKGWRSVFVCIRLEGCDSDTLMASNPAHPGFPQRKGQPSPRQARVSAN